ncbi:NAD kinase [Bacteroidota bacterium]
MKIALHGKFLNKETSDFLSGLILAGRNYECEIIISKDFYDLTKDSCEEVAELDTFKDKEGLGSIRFIFSIGGDGTLLESVSMVGNLGIPVLGINTGRLGFLSTTKGLNPELVLDAVLQKQYIIDDRALLRLDSPGNIYNDTNFALNEIAILKSDTSSMITVHAYIDDEYLNSYWADGLIVSTPTGSTGYSMSCGGPIALPKSNNFIITPVSPHNLSVRPMIVSDSSHLKFVVESRTNQYLISLDSRSKTLTNKVDIIVFRESFSAKLVRLKGVRFFDTLRQKLNWGYDIRN